MRESGKEALKPICKTITVKRDGFKNLTVLNKQIKKIYTEIKPET